MCVMVNVDNDAKLFKNPYIVSDKELFKTFSWYPIVHMVDIVIVFNI